MRRAALLCSLLFATALAGCSDGAPAEDPEDELFEETQDLSTGKGLIRGVVVDASILAVPDARVVVQGQDLETQSGENGAFTFTDVEPGTYFLEVSKAGWSRVQQSVEVQADVEKPPVAKILLERIPGSEPRAVTLSQEGIIICSIGEPLADHSCDVTGDQKTDIVFDIEGAPDWIQTEIMWESTQPAGDNLYVIQGVCACDGLPGFDQRFDETSNALSVHTARADPGFLDAHDVGGAAKQLYVDVSASGPTLGTGLALDQGFTVYATYFYNIEAPAEDWRFTSDGPYPTP